MTLARAFFVGLVSGVGFVIGQSLVIIFVARWNARLAAKAARAAAEAKAATDRALAVAEQKRRELAERNIQPAPITMRSAIDELKFRPDSIIFLGGRHVC